MSGALAVWNMERTAGICLLHAFLKEERAHHMCCRVISLLGCTDTRSRAISPAERSGEECSKGQARRKGFVWETTMTRIQPPIDQDLVIELFVSICVHKAARGGLARSWCEAYLGHVRRVLIRGGLAAYGAGIT